MAVLIEKAFSTDDLERIMEHLPGPNYAVVHFYGGFDYSGVVRSF
jgi:hypothetical protein